MSALFLIQQEHKKAAQRYESDARSMRSVSDPERVAALLRCSYGASWAMIDSSPDVRMAKNKRLDAAAARLKDLYSKDPTYSFAQRCWQVSRGNLPREASFFYREMERLRSPSKSAGQDSGPTV